MELDDLVLRSATWITTALATGELTATEVVEAHIDRIERLNPSINAVVQLVRERALSEADAIDNGEPHSGGTALRGLPFTVKDNYETAGIPTAVGVSSRKEVVPREDASLVAEVRHRGAILIAKTNCPPWGAGIDTNNEVYGRTRNPYDTSRTPGGSSGGEAAAIACGMSPLGLGTDSGGSVRIPAHFCGVAAILPTAGLLPLSGVLDDDGAIGTISDPRTRAGIMARGVDDLWLALHALLPITGHDEATVPLEISSPKRFDIGDLRVAFHIESEIIRPDDDTAAVVENAAAALADAGAKVEQVAPPPGAWEITREVWRSYGSDMRADELYRVLRRWDGYRRMLMGFLRTYDVILSPVFSGPAPTPDRLEKEGISFTAPYSLTDSPSAVVRCGTSPDGLPIGVQIVSASWRDGLVLATASYLETRFGGWRPPKSMESRGGESNP